MWVSTFTNIIGSAVKLTSLPLCMRCGRAIPQRVWPKTSRSKSYCHLRRWWGEGVKRGEWWWVYFANKNSAGTKLTSPPSVCVAGGLFPKGFGQKPIGLEVMVTVGGDGGEGVKEGEWTWAYFANKNSADRKLTSLSLCMRCGQAIPQWVWPKSNGFKSYGRHRRWWGRGCETRWVVMVLFY
jgi:ribosomal protein L39E